MKKNINKTVNPYATALHANQFQEDNGLITPEQHAALNDNIVQTLQIQSKIDANVTELNNE